MRYSIITPTLLRDSLSRLCQSIDQQSCTDWEHIVMVDSRDRHPELMELITSIEHPQRTINYCAKAHKDWGNTCRREAWYTAQGDYLLYIDDDNYLADSEVLETLNSVTKPFALFPLLYKGVVESPLPISIGRSDVNTLLVRRDIGKLSGRHTPEVDGMLIEELSTMFPYEVLDTRGLVVYDEEHYGQKQWRPPKNEQQ